MGRWSILSLASCSFLFHLGSRPVHFLESEGVTMWHGEFFSQLRTQFPSFFCFVFLVLDRVKTKKLLEHLNDEKNADVKIHQQLFLHFLAGHVDLKNSLILRLGFLKFWFVFNADIENPNSIKKKQQNQNTHQEGFQRGQLVSHVAHISSKF